MNDKKMKRYLLAVIIVVVLSMLPLMVLSIYDHPSADDFTYSIKTYHAWKGSGSIISVIKTAIETSAEYWHTWQGLYTSAFLLALQPAIFGEGCYAVTGILMIGIIFAGNIFFAYYMIHHVLNGSKLEGFTVGSVMSFLMIQWMPSFVEGLYWYNGAMNYVFFFSLMEVLICLTIGIGRTRQKKQVISIIAGCITGVLVAGGNHVTAFLSIIYLILLCIMSFLVNKGAAYRWNLIVLVATVLGFLMNVVSPGTRIRQSKFNEGYGVFASIKAAIFTGMDYVNGWIGVALIVCIVVLLPVIFKIVSQFKKETGFMFPYPFLVLLVSLGMVCAMFCPPLYAMGNFGAGRLLNVVYFTFILVVFVNVFYLCGWVQTHIFTIDENKVSDLSGSFIIVVCALFLGLIVTAGNEAGAYYSLGMLRDGTAKAYSEEVDQRIELLKNSQGEKVEVSGYSIWPPLLYFDDITDNPKDWRNKAVKKYYDLKSIKLK